ncbi:MAG: ribulose 1,5-bisphosphate carboxylase [Deltaproteobacteria bacterium CG11_big_fil_rev_8_21_14_0_20_49_13]|nr:MAG: ribulose 1,5-bisphosphate carboxylase [Deltaproteobacteria bacterium CG11_big_fil_rev_8_21_14_0_20_49_13]
MSFFADGDINLDDYIVETYFFESTIDPKEAAEHLCQEQSTAQWKRVGVDEDLRTKHGAKILDLRIIEKSPSEPANLRTCEPANPSWCEVKIAHPHINFGAKIPNLLTAAAGEGAFFSPGITTIKLTDIEFPEKFVNQFEGPMFGIKGLRGHCNIINRPFFIGVVKPNIGLSPKDFAKLAFEAWVGGLDIAKDDEMLSDAPWSSLSERTKLCAEAAKKAEDLTGEKKMFLANITDEVDELLRLHDLAVKNGAGMVMVNVMAVGLSAVRMLRKHSKVPIVAHFDFIAPMSRLPFHGISSELLTKLQRIVGCDIIIMPGFGERMKTSDTEVLSNVNECNRHLGKLKSSLPTPGGSDWAGTLPSVYDKLKTFDFGFVPGRGVFGHPMGPKGGAQSLRQAWEAILNGISLTEHSKNNPELKSALDLWSARS